MVCFKPPVILSSHSAQAWWISYGPQLFVWADSMPKQTRAGLKKWKMQQHNSAADPRICGFTLRWDRQDVEQIKTPPKVLQLNKLCARTRKLALHEVVKAQCFSPACLERGGLEPESLIPLSNSTSRISTAVTVTVSLIPAVAGGFKV